MNAIVHAFFDSTATARFSRALGALVLSTGLLAATTADAADPRVALLADRDVVATAVDRGPGHRQPRARDEHRDWRGEERHGYRGYDRDRHYEVRAARRYAAEAVDQAREARRLGRYPDHPRWSLSFERHFEWALRASPRKMEREHYRRAAQLREWRREAAWWHEQRSHRPW